MCQLGMRKDSRGTSLLFQALLLTCLGWTGCVEVLEGSGHEATETREVDVFSAVVAQDMIDVEVVLFESEAESSLLEVSGEDNLLPYVQTYVVDETLYIQLEPDLFYLQTLPLRVKATPSALTNIQTDTGATVIGWGMGARQLEVHVQGSSLVQLSGDVSQLEVIASGNAVVRLQELEATRASLISADSADVTLCALAALTIVAGGQSRVTYYCNPVEVDAEASEGAIIMPAE